MILEGGEPSGELSAGLWKVSVNLSQLIRFNSVKQRRRDRTEKYRHFKNNEPLLPVLIGLMEYSRTGKKKLIDWLAAEGVSISNDHFMYLRRSISNQVYMKYQANGLACPVDFTFNQSRREQFWMKKTRQTFSVIHRYLADSFGKTKNTSFL